MPNTVELVGDADNPTSMITHTKSGNAIDLQNLPGRLKLRLIQEGEMEIDQFMTPPNMPGHKLKALRTVHRAKVEEQLKEFITTKEKSGKELVVGDFVTFRGGSYEILKVREDGVMINMKLEGDTELKNVWIPKKKVKKG